MSVLLTKAAFIWSKIEYKNLILFQFLKKNIYVNIC